MLLPASALARDRATQKKINRAIDRGIEFFLQYFDGQLRGDPSGSLSLSVYALLKSGVSPTEPFVAKALEKIAEGTTARTYETAVKILCLTEADPLRYRKSIEKAAKVLLSNQQYGGGFSYTAHGRIDNSNSQFGLLGFWGAEKAGVKVPPDAWKRGLEHFLGAGAASGGTLATTQKGWGYTSEGASTRSMTAAGLGSLYLCVASLEGRVSAGQKSRARARISQGLQWLARRLALDKTDSHWHYYYLYAVERVGAFSGERLLGDVDWYQSGAAYLVDAQLDDGGWNARASLRTAPGRARGRAGRRGRTGGGVTQAGAGDPVTTAFALLFLTRATSQEGGITRSPTLELLEDLGPQPQPRDLKAARIALKRIGRAAVPDLIGALSTPNFDIRSLAVELLRELTGQAFGYDPIRAAADNERAIACWEIWYLKEGADASRTAKH